MKYAQTVAIGFFLTFVFGAQFGLSGCTKHNDAEAEASKKIDMKTFEEDVAVPNELYSEVLKVYRPLALDTTHGGGGEEEGGEKKEEHGGAPAGRTTLKTKPTIEQVPLKVLLTEKSKGILGGRNLRLEYPAGGGLLDYRGFLQSPTPGYFLFNIEIEDLEPKDLEVFYLSRARIRKIGTKDVGNGCERYFKLTKVWNDAAKNGGMELFTGDQRHVSLTAGVFFFVFPYKGKIRMAHLTVRDSRYKDLECGKE